MSDCRKFGQVSEEEKSPEDRLLLLEKVWPTVVEKIQSYDCVLSGFSQLKDRIDLIYQELNAIYSKNKNSSEYLDAWKKSYEQKNIEILSFISECKKNIDNLNCSSTDVNEKINSLSTKTSSNIDDLSNKHKDIESKVCLKSEVNAFKLYIDSKFDSLMDLVTINRNLSIDTCKVNADKIMSQDEIILKLSNKVLEIDAHLSKIDILEKSITAILLSLNDIKSSQKAQIDLLVDQKIEEFKSKNDQLPDVLRNEFMKKLEGVALDGSNAVLKANNSSQQIFILEKKIENIYLQIKKLELAK